jgi:hypothetical protein
MRRRSFAPALPGLEQYRLAGAEFSFAAVFREGGVFVINKRQLLSENRGGGVNFKDEDVLNKSLTLML